MVEKKHQLRFETAQGHEKLHFFSFLQLYAAEQSFSHTFQEIIIFCVGRLSRNISYATTKTNKQEIEFIIVPLYIGNYKKNS